MNHTTTTKPKKSEKRKVSFNLAESNEKKAEKKTKRQKRDKDSDARIKQDISRLKKEIAIWTARAEEEKRLYPLCTCANPQWVVIQHPSVVQQDKTLAAINKSTLPNPKKKKPLQSVQVESASQKGSEKTVDD